MARVSWLVASLAAVAAATKPAQDHAPRPGISGVRDLIQQSHHDGQPPRSRGELYAPEQPLECFEVASPILHPGGLYAGSESFGESPIPDAPSCEVVLMDHHFANSYGQPFVAKYEPPEGCPFNRVALNLTVVSEGRQFDRLAIMYLTDNEIWRTSTAEPTQHPGIHWTVWKDVTPFLSLWHQPQTLIFDLGNIVDDTYTGLFNTTLTATFIQVDDFDGPHAQPADVIVPISAHRGSDGAASAFNYPEVQAIDRVKLPRNIKRAVFSVAATGQGAEEFWWSNVPQSKATFFNSSDGALPALSSFREVRVSVDGQIVGLAWPFPVVFTGGVSPPLHRPIVGIQAFDLREEEIDITAWLGVLCDGGDHEFTIEVVGVDDTGGEPTFRTVPMSWVLTGKIFIWLDESPDSVTTGTQPIMRLGRNNYKAVQGPAENRTLNYAQTVDRNLVIESKVKTQLNDDFITWGQRFFMTNNGIVKDNANSQWVNATYHGSHMALRGDHVNLITEYKYPIYTNNTYKSPDGENDFSISADFSQGFISSVIGESVYPSGIEPFLYKLKERVAGAIVDATRSGSAFFYRKDNEGEKTSGGYGSMLEDYRFGYKTLSGPHLVMNGPLFTRKVAESNESIIQDSRYVYKSDHVPPAAFAKSSTFQPETGGLFAPPPGASSLDIFWSKDGGSKLGN